MQIELKEKTLIFEETPVIFKERNVPSPFITKNNKTLLETLEHPKYKLLEKELSELSDIDLKRPLGDYLNELKTSKNKNYLKFLNKYGDNMFCEFSIASNLNDNGIYCWVVDEKIKYVGRCTDNFKKRVNQGYGRINAKNCFKDGQATNCHLNSEINKYERVKFFVYKMTDKSKEEIHVLEKEILSEMELEWNVQKS